MAVYLLEDESKGMYTDSKKALLSTGISQVYNERYTWDNFAGNCSVFGHLQGIWAHLCNAVYIALCEWPVLVRLLQVSAENDGVGL